MRKTSDTSTNVSYALDAQGVPKDDDINQNNNVTLIYKERVSGDTDFEFCFKLTGLSLGGNRGVEVNGFQWGYKLYDTDHVTIDAVDFA